MKGADNVILERLGSRPNQRAHYDSTLAQLEKFAKEGLRTLCLGFCVIKEGFRFYDCLRNLFQDFSQN